MVILSFHCTFKDEKSSYHHPNNFFFYILILGNGVGCGVLKFLEKLEALQSWALIVIFSITFGF